MTGREKCGSYDQYCDDDNYLYSYDTAQVPPDSPRSCDEIHESLHNDFAQLRSDLSFPPSCEQLMKIDNPNEFKLLRKSLTFSYANNSIISSMNSFTEYSESICGSYDDSDSIDEYGFFGGCDAPLPSTPKSELNSRVSTPRNQKPNSIIKDEERLLNIVSANEYLANLLDKKAVVSFSKYNSGDVMDKTGQPLHFCGVSNISNEVTCKSFNAIVNDGGINVNVDASIALTGLRIVSSTCSGCNEHVEYQFTLKVGLSEFIAWRQYEEFRSLSNSLSSFSSTIFKKSYAAWNRVVANRPWFGRNISKSYLITEAMLIEKFMREFFFESLDLQLLTEFFQ
eukprot:gene10997-14771_t